MMRAQTKGIAFAVEMVMLVGVILINLMHIPYEDVLTTCVCTLVLMLTVVLFVDSNAPRMDLNRPGTLIINDENEIHMVLSKGVEWLRRQRHVELNVYETHGKS